MRLKPLPDYNMRIIKNGAAREETLPLPCYPDDDGVLQYDSEFADDLIIAAYGENAGKYVNKPSIKSSFIDSKSNKVKGMSSEEYFKAIIDKLKEKREEE